MTDASTPAPVSEPDAYPPNVLGVSAIILSLTGIFFVFSFGIASLLGIGLGVGSLVRSRRRRGQKGGVGIVAIALGIVGLGVTACVFARIFSGDF
jgi:hypothetical protein